MPFGSGVNPAALPTAAMNMALGACLTYGGILLGRHPTYATNSYAATNHTVTTFPTGDVPITAAPTQVAPNYGLSDEDLRALKIILDTINAIVNMAWFKSLADTLQAHTWIIPTLFLAVFIFVFIYGLRAYHKRVIQPLMDSINTLHATLEQPPQQPGHQPTTNHLDHLKGAMEVICTLQVLTLTSNATLFNTLQAMSDTLSTRFTCTLESIQHTTTALNTVTTTLNEYRNNMLNMRTHLYVTNSTVQRMNDAVNSVLPPLQHNLETNTKLLASILALHRGLEVLLGLRERGGSTQPERPGRDNALVVAGFPRAQYMDPRGHVGGRPSEGPARDVYDASASNNRPVGAGGVGPVGGNNTGVVGEVEVEGEEEEEKQECPGVVSGLEGYHGNDSASESDDE